MIKQGDLPGKQLTIKKTRNIYDKYCLVPKQGDKELGDKVWNLLSALVKDKDERGLYKQWDKNRATVKSRDSGDKITKNDKLKPEISKINFLRLHIKRVVNMITANSPKFEITVGGYQGEEAVKNAEQINYAATDWFRRTNQLFRFGNNVNNGEIYGTCFSKIMFDPDKTSEGETDTIPILPYNFALYPKESVEINAETTEAVFYFYPKQVRLLKKEFKEKADSITQNDSLIETITPKNIMASGLVEKAKSSLVQFNGKISRLFSSSSKDSTEDAEEPMTLVCEMWVKDDSMVETTYNIIDDKTGDEYEEVIEEQMYPGGIRLITVCSGGEVVLEDRANPNINPYIPEEYQLNSYLLNNFPFVSGGASFDALDFYNQSDLEIMAPQHDQLRKDLSRINAQNHLKIWGKFIIPESSGIISSQVNQTSPVLQPLTQNHGLSFTSPPPIDPNSIGVADMQKKLLFDQLGTFDLTAAHKGTGNVVSHGALEVLKEEVSLIHLDKLRSYTNMLIEMGKMWLSNAINFYTMERWIAFQDKDSGEKRSFPFVNSQFGGESINFSIVTGSTMPVSKHQRREEALTFATQGLIPQDEFLRAVDWPNATKIIKRSQAGALGEAMEKLSLVLPQETIALMNEIAGAPMEELQKAKEKGELPPIKLRPDNPEEDPQVVEEQLRLDKIKKEVEEVESKIMLNAEKAKTEQEKQTQIKEGIERDKEMIENDQAKIIADMEKKTKKDSLPKSFSDQRTQGPYRGSTKLKSDNSGNEK